MNGQICLRPHEALLMMELVSNLYQKNEFVKDFYIILESINDLFQFGYFLN